MAIEDAVNRDGYDEIIISTLPLGDLAVAEARPRVQGARARAAGHARGGRRADAGAGRRIAFGQVCAWPPSVPPDAAEPLAGTVADGRVHALAGGAGGARRARRRGRRRAAMAARGRWPRSSCWRPVPRPGTIYAIGLNYAKHIEETGGQRPEQPIVFVKVAGSLTGPARPGALPGGGPPARLRGRADDRDGRRRADRRLHDRRRHQRARPPGPRAAVDARQGCGHVLPGRALGDHRRRGGRPGTLSLRTWVNGELRQDSSTARSASSAARSSSSSSARPARWRRET